jgi:hypothetical protein
MNDAEIDVSGGHGGGGTIRVGGDYQGKNPTSRTPALPISARMPR